MGRPITDIVGLSRARHGHVEQSLVRLQPTQLKSQYRIPFFVWISEIGMRFAFKPLRSGVNCRKAFMSRATSHGGTRQATCQVCFRLNSAGTLPSARPGIPFASLRGNMRLSLHLLAYGGRDLCHDYRSILKAAHRSIPSVRLKPLRSLAGVEIPNREKGASR